jgi:hypothetical protein
LRKLQPWLFEVKSLSTLSRLPSESLRLIGIVLRICQIQDRPSVLYLYQTYFSEIIIVKFNELM